MADELTDAIQQLATDGVQSATADGRTVVAVPLPDQIAADKYLRSLTASAGTNPQGGSVSAWARTRPARVIPPGGV